MNKAKKYLRYVSSLCFIGMFSFIFIPIIKVNTYQLSVFDILKTTLNGAQDIKLLKEMQEVMYHYMFKYLFLFGIAIALMLIAAVLCALQDENTVYKGSIIYALFINIYTSIVILFCFRTIKMLDFSTILYKINISFNVLTILIWELVTLIIIVIGIIGTKIKSNDIQENEDNLPEDLDDLNVILDTMQEIPNVNEPTKRQINKVLNEQPVIEEQKTFEGMILNTNRKVLILENRKEVYITDNNHIDISSSKQGIVIGKIYYISQYREYCVMPLERRTIFLMSGQPLGVNRFYYLKRGTILYIKNKNNKYKLC